MQNTDQLLSCTCLPRLVQVEHPQDSVNILEDNGGFRNDSHEQNIINLTCQILDNQNCARLLFLTQCIRILFIPSRCGFFLFTHAVEISNGSEKSATMRFHNVVHLSKYIIDTYDKLSSYVQI